MDARPEPVASAKTEEWVPLYDYSKVRAAFKYHPEVVVAVDQPAAIATQVPPPVEDNRKFSIFSLVFSLLTLIACGGSVVTLPLSIPALILSIMALRIRGDEQMTAVWISVALNATAFFGIVSLLAVVVTPTLVVIYARS